MNNQILQNINAVQNAFQEGKKIASLHNLVESSSILSTQKSIFQSAFFEGASYEIAQQNFAQLEKNWLPFLLINNQHETQICIGLGWALAENNCIEISKELHFLSHTLQQKVANGFGFYEGTFRKRKAFFQLEKSTLEEGFWAEYYCGLGRSLWYQLHADLESIKTQIEKFEPNFQPLLWQGIGIASAYVGGMEDAELEQLKEVGKPFLTNIHEGIKSCAATRKKANLPTENVLKALAFFSQKQLKRPNTKQLTSL